MESDKFCPSYFAITHPTRLNMISASQRMQACETVFYFLIKIAVKITGRDMAK